jgi:hypothetical protein
MPPLYGGSASIPVPSDPERGRRSTAPPRSVDARPARGPRERSPGPLGGTPPPHIRDDCARPKQRPLTGGSSSRRGLASPRNCSLPTREPVASRPTRRDRPMDVRRISRRDALIQSGGALAAIAFFQSPLFAWARPGETNVPFLDQPPAPTSAARGPQPAGLGSADPGLVDHPQRQVLPGRSLRCSRGRRREVEAGDRRARRQSALLRSRGDQGAPEEGRRLHAGVLG